MFLSFYTDKIIPPSPFCKPFLGTVGMSSIHTNHYFLFPTHTYLLETVGQIKTYLLCNQGVSWCINVLMSLVHCNGSKWHLLFFSPQQSQNRRVLREISQVRHLFHVLRLQGTNTKTYQYPFWSLKYSLLTVYAKNAWSLCASRSGNLLPFFPN